MEKIEKQSNLIHAGKKKNASLIPREVSIDLLESIAIFLVVMYHSTIYSSNFIIDSSASTYVNYLFRTLLSPCVALFFFANGYLLFSREFNLKKHIYKIIRLILLCVIWGIVKTFIFMFVYDEILTPLEFLKTLWFFKDGWINSLWFLGALVGVYLVFPILKCTYDNNKKIFFYFIIICLILTFGNVVINEIGTIFSALILGKNIIFDEVNFFNIFNPLRMIRGYVLVYFCLGGYFYQLKESILKIKLWKRNLIAIVIMVISCVCLMGIGILYSKITGEIWDVVWNGYDTIFTFINTICIYVLCLNLNKDVYFIRLISCNTLGIYFLHEIFIEITRNTIMENSLWCNPLFNIVYSVFLILLCLLLCIIIKKIPIIKKLVS